MIGFIGYNFFSDANALDPTPTNVVGINRTKLQNAIFDNFNITKNVEFDYNSIIPLEWDLDTLINASFEGNINAGNISELQEDITSVRIKRRVKGEFEWTTLREVKINDLSDLSFILNDNLASYNVEYEYAFVPVVGNTEGSYTIDTILSKFNGVFICDADTVFKVRAGVEYNGNTMSQQIGVFQPYNRQYPVVVSNSVIQYRTGAIGGWVLPETWETDKTINRNEITQEKNALINFLTNKKPKVIKDMNSNNWLVFFTGNPTTTYDNSFGQGMVKFNAEWTEVGSVADKEDLYENGLIPTKE